MYRLYYSIVLLVCIPILGCQPNTSSLEYNTTINKDNTYKVLLLLGQSNMVGMGNVEDLVHPHLPSNITYKNYALQTDLTANSSKFGPEVGLSKVLHSLHPNDHFLFLKFAIGGSSLYDWQKDYSKEKASITKHPEFGPIYQSMLDSITLQLKLCKHSIEGILWMQGETDAMYAESAEEYQKNLEQLIHNLYSDFNLTNQPFIIGKISPTGNLFPYTNSIQKAQEKVADKIAFTHIIPTDSIEKWGDNLHYSSLGQQQLGIRFSEELLKHINL